MFRSVPNAKLFIKYALTFIVVFLITRYLHPALYLYSLNFPNTISTNICSIVPNTKSSLPAHLALIFTVMFLTLQTL